MAASADLGTADLRALVNLVGDAKDDHPGPAIPWALLSGLEALIQPVDVGLNQFDVRNRRVELIQGVGGGEALVVHPKLLPTSRWWTDFPRLEKDDWGDHPPVVIRWSARDLLPKIQRTALYEEFWEPSTDCIGIKLPAASGHERRLAFWRVGGETFSARDEALLTLLLPHLIEIDRDAQRRRAGTPHLTPRETQVLELVAQGLSNTEIAHALVTSVSTVRKHLEHIYERTETHSRSAAVAKMLPR